VSLRFDDCTIFILNFWSPLMGSLNHCNRTCYRSSINTAALNCLVFEKIAFFCRAMLCKRRLSWPMSSCGVCLSVRQSVTFVSWVKMNKLKRSIKICHHRVATPFWFFHAKRHSKRIPSGTPANGGVECRWGNVM